MTEHEWDVKCQAAFIGLYGSLRLCADIGMDIELLVSMLKDRLRDDGCLLPDGRVVAMGKGEQEADDGTEDL